MNDPRYAGLISGYLAGTLQADEKEEFLKLMEEGRIDSSEVSKLEELYRNMDLIEVEAPAREQMKSRFYDMLREEKRRDVRSGGDNARPPMLYQSWLLRAAAAAILVLAGFSAGIIAGSMMYPAGQVKAVQQEVDQIKNALVFNAYQQTSASERMQAVGLVSGLDDADDQLLMILIHAMNNDPNVNVRLASVGALRSYAGREGVRGAFVQALAVQNNPFIQLALIDTLVELNERSATGEMQKLLLADSTEPEVKERILEGLAELRG